MRHEQIAARDTYSKVDIMAVWPTGAQIAPLPIPDIEQADPARTFAATPAAPDIPAAVGWMIVLSYVALIAAFATATVASAHSVYMITISALFVVAFFTVPWLFFRQELGVCERPAFDRFMREGMDTLTGHSTGRAALVQMLIVPVFLTAGVLAMGVAGAIIL